METPLAVALGILGWIALSLLFAFAWSRFKCAARNKRRRDEAAQRLTQTVETITRSDYLVVIRNGRREVIDLTAESARLETWVNDPANHRRNA